ncbi:transcriptional initiation protein Tat [Halogeometricum borinquense]|uniref:Transcriptional initiation protein Tat n=2 Tax=Halogeometricum borinquense TaxID=60847 RepID=A0A482TLU4_9EURY|nr:transcriptional initiation protein Tat [Halogeometricum borinquense]
MPSDEMSAYMETRRTVLRALPASVLALLGGCLGSPPHGTGPRRPPDAPAGQSRQTPEKPDLYVKTFDFDKTENGNLRVFGDVGNRGDVERVATVQVRVTRNGKEYTQETTVTVASGTTASFSVTFGISQETFLNGGSLNVDLV